MKQKKPSLEKIQPLFGSSIEIKHYAKGGKNELANWHFHPEMELVYVNGGSGKRHIGSHISYYNDGDLIFIGANLPHFGFTDRLSGNKSETVIQVREDFLGNAFLDAPEMVQIKQLFERAKRGIVFEGNTKMIIGEKIEALAGLNHFDRLFSFLNILNELAQSKEFAFLNIEGMVIETEPQDNERINAVFNLVREEFKRSIPLEEVASLTSMTVPAFCRYFKKNTGKTFTKFVNEYRLVHALKLLAEKPASITDICFESGFNNFSHFNKSFKEYTGKSPSKYRSELKKTVQ